MEYVISFCGFFPLISRKLHLSLSDQTKVNRKRKNSCNRDKQVLFFLENLYGVSISTLEDKAMYFFFFFFFEIIEYKSK